VNSLYLHIPFCEKKCVYCDFYSIETLAPMDTFLEALHREIDLYAEYGSKGAVGTVYLGGGTPSLLTPTQLEWIMVHLNTVFTIAPEAEITVEANPGTVTRDKLAAYRSLGVNRISIGVQSFQDEELTFLSRIHTGAQAIECITRARAAGFGNVGLDLIYSLPGQTRDRWEKDLRTALDLSPQHISAYSLVVEHNTPLARMVRTKLITPNPADAEADLFEYTMEEMASGGYEHYEVSNFALPGYRSRHNSNYWSHVNYLGFGPSAHSFWRQAPREGKRWANGASLSGYCEALGMQKRPVAFEETVGSRELANEHIFLGLRSGGLDRTVLKSEFGVDLQPGAPEIIRQLAKEGRAVVDGAVVRLTPKGFLLCDEIAGRLMI
jgi:oxygen-independent coproporphyrinogen-3 oxidase